MGGLDPWYALQNDISSLRMCTYGDSATVVVGATNGGWVQQLRVLANTRWGNGGDGIHAVGNGAGLTRNWVFTTGGNAWTGSGASDAWSGAFLQGQTMLANGATKTATWTNPSLNVDSFMLYIIDGSGSADFSYSLDSGSNWINAGFTGLVQDNTMKRVTINTPVGASSTVMVRAANAAGTAVNLYLIGLNPRTKSPGLVIDNVSQNTAALAGISQQGTRPWQDYLNLIQPKLAVICFTNDVLTPTFLSNYQTNMQNFCDGATANGGSVLFINFFEQDPTNRPIADQANLRAQNKAAAKAKGMPCLDLYDLVGDFAATNVLGYLNADKVHPSDAGCVFMAQQVWKIIAGSRVGAGFKAA